MLTIWPPPCAFIRRAACFESRNGARRLTSITASHCAVSSSSMGTVKSTAALLTSTSRRPMPSSARAISASLVTSSFRARPRTLSATALAPASLRSATTMRAPPRASSRQMAAPRPRAPPVTSTLLPSSDMAHRPAGDVLVQRADRARHLRPGELLVHAVDGVAAELPAMVRVRAHARQRRGEAPRVLRRYQVPGEPVGHAVADAADVGAGHRRAAGHGLERGDAEGLVPRRGHEYVGGAVVELQELAA